ncbi:MULTISPECIES: glycosyltransferase family 4 protein [unclassified Streptomyces]|uniref:glycosyltransferase family 4 protein n=1 Tax=unclassified Streptomyces TaxID=2593676 RepID=UPI0007ED7024|nr:MULTISPECIES: glycosyltransferase family 4 protein [unclassified Streptomyces]MCP3770655.1 glycosyltransferase family 4 protein [Streptomyces sp. MAR25Y5]OBQ47511.1 glycosyltransferase [Streptomyces sp. H-KF8]
MTPVSSHSPHGRPPLRTVQVLGGGTAATSAHVRSLAAGLVARGVRVTVCAPAEAEHVHDFTGVGAEHVHAPRSSDPGSVAALRAACADTDLVHAHGLHASFRTALALGGRHTPLIVTWHDRTPAEGARAHVLRLMERRVVKAATVVLGTTSVLVDRARRSGARDARLAAVAFPGPRTAPRTEDPDGSRLKLLAELGATGRPLLIAVGALERHRGHHTLLDATHGWRRLEPQPLVAVAGEGPLRGELQRRITDEDLPVRLVGGRDDITDLLGAADLALLPSRREGRPVLAQQALHARVPLVAADTGGIPELVGDAAELVPYRNARALADAVVRLLGDPGRRDELRAKGARQAAGWPTEDEAVAQVLSVYDELARPRPLS